MIELFITMLGMIARYNNGIAQLIDYHAKHVVDMIEK